MSMSTPPYPSEMAIFTSHEGSHEFHAEDGTTYGGFEVFFHDGGHMVEADENDDMPLDDWRDAESAGWYWRACMPGCIPDGEPSGPFTTSIDAFCDADEFHPDYADE